MIKIRKQVGIVGLALVPLAIGLAVGLAVPMDFIRDKIASSLEDSQAAQGGHSHGAAADAGAQGESSRVELTQTAQESMALRTGRIQYSSYESSFDVPAFVREIPGASDLRVASRFTGMVRKVLISEGQTVQPGQPILEIELTGDLLASAQAELLEAQKQVSIVEKEIARLEPSVAGGGVATKRLIEVRYERDRLVARVETKSQELLVRGLTKQQVDDIIQTKMLLRSVVVSVPEDLIPPQLNAGKIMEGSDQSFIVEQLVAKPGAMTNSGDDLCKLSFHAVLAIEGQAYEKDLMQIRQAISLNQPITISIGPDGSEQLMTEQQIAYLSNHVDERTNTYPFYVYLTNEKLFVDASGVTSGDYVAWKWKPGQRAHIAVPDRQFENSILIPRDALAIDGLNSYVFRWNGAVQHDHAEGVDHEPHEPMDDFQAIEVIVTHVDRQFAVIDPGDKLQPGDRIVFNNASQLLFAMQAGSGGGGGHSHHGHSH